jgi:hypothetical protein
MSIVYAVQESPGKNLLGATDYGEVKFLLPPDRQLTLSPGPVARELRQGLVDFTEADYLLLIGDPAAIGIACVYAAEQNRGRFKLLKWDKQQSRYYPIQVDVYSENRQQL